LAGWLRCFASAAGGGVAVPFAVMLVPLTLLVFGAADYQRASQVRVGLQESLDAAALAVGRSTAESEAEVQALGANVLQANLRVFGDDVELISSDFNLNSGKVTASASAKVKPVAADLLMQDITVGATTEVARSKNVEVAMVLDTTGSMQGQKIIDLRAAANDLVDIVVKDSQTPFYSKVAVVPYSMGVNASTYAAAVRGTYPTGTSTTPGSQRYRFFNPYGEEKTFTISSCVTERTGANAYTDAAPTTTLLGRNYPSPDNPCSVNAFVPLSSDRPALKTKINALQASGSTAGHVGVGWGWYLVSPNFGYLFPAASRPAAYASNNLVKAVVLMTDGEYNSSYCNGVISKDSTTGSGATSEHINCNASNGHAFNQATTLCTNMKAAGVIVYTVGFNVVNDQRAKDLVNQCATSSAHVYLPSGGAALKSAFRAIAQDISSLRLSR